MMFVNFFVLDFINLPKVDNLVRCWIPLKQELLRFISNNKGSQFLGQNGSVYAYIVRQFFHYSPVRLSPELWPWPSVIRLSVLQDALENSLFYASPVHCNNVNESVGLYYY